MRKTAALSCEHGFYLALGKSRLLHYLQNRCVEPVSQNEDLALALAEIFDKAVEYPCGKRGFVIVGERFAVRDQRKAFLVDELHLTAALPGVCGTGAVDRLIPRGCRYVCGEIFGLFGRDGIPECKQSVVKAFLAVLAHTKEVRGNETAELAVFFADRLERLFVAREEQLEYFVVFHLLSSFFVLSLYQ